ncbi:MAG: hypothetical protein JXA69_21060 [Phycisphaerae bacterium]|nr:hypothetical protein [Phycisphaerae bacterium]
MKSVFGICAVAALAQAIPSCLVTNPQTTVRLVNNTSHTVEVQLFYDDTQELPKDLIKLDGTEVNQTVLSGAVQTFSRDCDVLQAIYIENAKLMVLGDIGPNEDTDAFHEPDDFSCGDTLTFTFTQNTLGSDLAIDFTAAP